MPCWRHLHLLQGAHCSCHDPSDLEAGVHGCRRRLCASLKAICTCFGVPFAAAVVQPMATAAAATPPGAPEPVTHPVLEEVSPLVCSESVVCVCHDRSGALKSMGCACHSPRQLLDSACGLPHIQTEEPSEGPEPDEVCTNAKLVSVLALVDRSCLHQGLSYTRLPHSSSRRYPTNNQRQAQHISAMDPRAGPRLSWPALQPHCSPVG